MHRQLAGLVEEYRTATVRLHDISRAVPDAHWTARPEPGRWSIAECVAHLNLTSEAMLPLVRVAVTSAQSLGRAGGRYRRDPAGWLLTVLLPPPVRFRVPTTAPFIPQSLTPPADLVARFEEYQASFLQCIRDAGGHAIDRVRVPSPFNTKAQYNLWSALMIVPRHQHRHLWQAERAWHALRGTQGG